MSKLTFRDRPGDNRRLNELEGELDTLLKRMQTPNARKGVDAAFKASPPALGRAAIKQARKRGR